MAEKILEVGNKRMKKIIALLTVCLAMAMTALAQQPAATPQQPATTAQNPQCSAESKLAWYNEFRANFKTDTTKANELAKKWLACPEAAGEEQQAAYLKNLSPLREKRIARSKY